MQLVERPTAAKDMSLVSLIPKWSGTEKATPLHEFFEAIEGIAKVGNWSETDKIQVAVLKLSETAKLFYNTALELHDKEVTWSKFKELFFKRFKDVRSDQFHYMELQTARQRKGETIQEFADRCRSLAHRTVLKVNDPVHQKFHYEQAERLPLNSFIAGLFGTPGTQVRYARPSSLEEALQIAISVDQAERQERRNNSFYVRYGTDSSQNGARKKTPRKSWENRMQAGTDRSQKESSFNSSTTRNAQLGRSYRCYQCGGEGHMIRECPRKPRSDNSKKFTQGNDRDKKTETLPKKTDSKGTRKKQEN